MTASRVISILRWMSGDAECVPGGVSLREIRTALELAIKSVAIDGVRVGEGEEVEP